MYKVANRQISDMLPWQQIFREEQPDCAHADGDLVHFTCGMGQSWHTQK
jgi:hypothetical protein